VVTWVWAWPAIGKIRNLLVADFAVHKLPLPGRKIGETGLDTAAGVSIIAV
jgi:hypothetical protein